MEKNKIEGKLIRASNLNRIRTEQEKNRQISKLKTFSVAMASLVCTVNNWVG